MQKCNSKYRRNCDQNDSAPWRSEAFGNNTEGIAADIIDCVKSGMKNHRNQLQKIEEDAKL